MSHLVLYASTQIGMQVRKVTAVQDTFDDDAHLMNDFIDKGQTDNLEQHLGQLISDGALDLMLNHYDTATGKGMLTISTFQSPDDEVMHLQIDNAEVWNGKGIPLSQK